MEQDYAVSLLSSVTAAYCFGKFLKLTVKSVHFRAFQAMRPKTTVSSPVVYHRTYSNGPDGELTL